ncbi:serine/threonine-protein kinase [Nocardia tenerifensis]|uniref:non-specific serine/threonine protein kinase n=1 Tax=Nocardia tenerifensis TaxID=228006 RepID=A0A318K3Z6_9NOCA|nr:serine/threonine-protein kinase [Nocardia tenerifensis]PXX66359.1 serine/threonine-protein kinase [Nocardia tenerifensis]
MGEVRFGGYRLARLLGRGGMGQVWLAHDDAAARWVALKLLPVELAADAGYRRRFEREAEVVARLRDPRIPRIHRFGEIDGRLFIDMEFVEGRDLSIEIASGALSPAAAVGVVGQVAAALDVAHRVGLVHRDVKPSNIVVHSSGFAYLIDFGIAHGIGQTAVTTTGLAIGTLAYMAPERFAGKADARSDVYSLACVLYECLTGARPYGDTDPAQQMHAHLTSDPPRAAARNAAVPVALDAVIARGMAKSPDDRYRTAGDFAAAAHAAIGTRSPVLPVRPPRTLVASELPANPPEPSASRAPGRMPEGPAPTKVMPEPGPAPTRVATRLDVPTPSYPRPQAYPSAGAVPQRRLAAGASAYPVSPPGSHPGAGAAQRDSVARQVGAAARGVRALVFPHSTRPKPESGRPAEYLSVPQSPPGVPQQRYPVGYGRRVFPAPAKAPKRHTDARRPPVRRPRRKRGGVLSKVVGALVVVFLTPFMLAAGCVALLAGTRSGDSGGTGAPRPTATAEENPAPPPEQPDTRGVAAAGIPVRDGKFEFVVADVDTGVHRVGLQSAAGSFVIVTLDVRNISGESKWFLPFGQRLFDAQGTPFDHNTTATMWQSAQHGYNYSFELPPGQSATTQLVFDLPADTSPNHLELHDFLLSNGVAVHLG